MVTCNGESYCDFCDEKIEENSADICKDCLEEGKYSDVEEYCPVCRKGFLVETRIEAMEYAEHLESHLTNQ